MRRSRELLAWFAAAAVLYGASAARTLQWADGSKLTLYALARHLPSLNPGDHPGWTLLAALWLRLVPAPAALALPILSALAGAVSVVLMHCLLEARAGLGAARGGALALLLAHPLWWSAATTETYAPALALALAAAVLSSRSGGVGEGFSAGLAAGMGAACHLFSLVVSGPFLVRGGRRQLAGGALGLAAGLAPVWLGLLAVPPDPLTGHLAGGAGSIAWSVQSFLHPHTAAAGAVRLAGLLLFGLGPVAIAAMLRRPAPAGRPPMLAPTLVLYAAILAGYAAYRQHLMVLFLAAGLLLLRPPAPGRRAMALHAAAQLSLYVALPALLTATGHGDLGVRQLPYRTNAWYFLCPVRCTDHGAERYARELLAAAPRRAVVLADFNPGAPLVALQRLHGLRPDLHILPTAVDEALGRPDPAARIAAAIHHHLAARRPVVLADRWEPYYRIHELVRRFHLEPSPCGPGLTVASPGDLWHNAAP